MNTVEDKEHLVVTGYSPSNTHRARSASQASHHRKNSGESGPTTTTTTPDKTLPRQSSAGSITVPKTLNARASLIMASSNSRTLPAQCTPPSSPRLRVASTGAQRDLSPLLFARGARDVSSSDNDETSLIREGKEEEEECEALEMTRRFITDSMKDKNKPPKRMSVGNINFFDHPLSSGASSEFCVTERSTPCGTPPPERSMPSDVAFREVARMRGEINKLRDEIKGMHKQQQEMNNFHYTLIHEREEEAKNQCFLFSWF